MRARDLGRFGSQLRQLTGDDPSLRPFVCDGSPLTCRAFIVGANPATTVAFWPYWDDDLGFDRPEWQAAYEARRVAAGKPRISNTRARIERIVGVAAPVRILETNVFVKPSRSTWDLAASARSMAVIEYLLRAVRPVVVVAHGREARQAMLDMKHVIDDVRVIESRHLSRVAYAEADDLGRQVRRVVEGD